MVIHSYSSVYLPFLSENIGLMVEYVDRIGINVNIFWSTFVNSNASRQIEKGNPKYLNMSFCDLLLDIYDGKVEGRDFVANSNCYYWAGWVLTQLQYYTGYSFNKINKYLSLDTVINLYSKFHEADINKFIDTAMEYFKKEDESNLKKIRKARGLSQRKLSELSMVHIRSIQMYEQRNNDINKAQGETLYRLARVLGCNIEDLLEL